MCLADIGLLKFSSLAFKPGVVEYCYTNLFLQCSNPSVSYADSSLSSAWVRLSQSRCASLAFLESHPYTREPLVPSAARGTVQACNNTPQSAVLTAPLSGDPFGGLHRSEYLCLSKRPLKLASFGGTIRIDKRGSSGAAASAFIVCSVWSVWGPLRRSSSPGSSGRHRRRWRRRGKESGSRRCSHQ